MSSGFVARLRRDLAGDIARLAAPGRRPDSPPVVSWPVGLALCAASFVLYLALGFRLGAGAYFAVDNLAFDFDPRRNVDWLFAGPAANGIRHPFFPWLRPLTQGLLALGLPLDRAVSAFFAAVGAASVLASYVYAAYLGVALLERILLTLFFALSATPLLVALVPESYGLSLLGIVLLFLCVLRRQAAPEGLGRARFAVALYLFGVTTINLAQAAIAEAILWFRVLPWREAASRLVSYGIILAALLLVGILASLDLPWFLHDPVLALKMAYWDGAWHGGERASPAALAEAFFGFSFVMPDFTAVPLPNGEATMLDFRDVRMSAAGAAALAIWLSLLAFGLVAGLRDRADRTLFLSLLAAVIFNLLTHLGVQYRASVFLYAAHLHFALFAIALLAVRDAGRRGGAARWAVVAAAAALVALAGWDNLARTLEFVSAFG